MRSSWPLRALVLSPGNASANSLVPERFSAGCRDGEHCRARWPRWLPGRERDRYQPSGCADLRTDPDIYYTVSGSKNAELRSRPDIHIPQMPLSLKADFAYVMPPTTQNAKDKKGLMSRAQP